MNARFDLEGMLTYSQNYLLPVINNLPICGGTVQSELKVLESDINSAVAAF